MTKSQKKIVMKNKLYPNSPLGPNESKKGSKSGRVRLTRA